MHISVSTSEKLLTLSHVDFHEMKAYSKKAAKMVALKPFKKQPLFINVFIVMLYFILKTPNVALDLACAEYLLFTRTWCFTAFVTVQLKL